MSAVLKASPSLLRVSGIDSRSLSEKFASRQSDELIIAFAGPMGCGITSLIESMSERLRERGYTDVVHIKLSKFLDQAIKDKLVKEWKPEPGSSQRRSRYRRLQEAGRELRVRSKNPAILAEYAVQEIAVDRTRRALEKVGAIGDGPIVPGRIAYLIDQVKRPEEVASRPRRSSFATTNVSPLRICANSAASSGRSLALVLPLMVSAYQ